jgi:CBS domain containing-hemolysin-like protein
MMEDFVRFGSAEYVALLGLLLGMRGADFLSTWVATPQLVLEGNPLARKLGWRWGALVNVAVCLIFAAWPLSALVIATTSALVAARNFQSAWLMRTLGEEQYRDWYIQRLRETPLPLYLFCLLGQTLLVAAVGASLMLFYGNRLVPFAVGLGIVAYAIAVVFYTSLALWRIRRSGG